MGMGMGITDREEMVGEEPMQSYMTIQSTGSACIAFWFFVEVEATNNYTHSFVGDVRICEVVASS